MIGIALTVFGIIFLVKKRIPYGKKREVRGPLVGLISFLLIVPFPLFFMYGVKLGWDAGRKGKDLDNDKLMNLTLTVELPVYLADALICWAMVAASAQPNQKKRPRFDDWDDDEDDGYDRAPRRRYGEDDDHYERGRRRRYAEEDADEAPRRHVDDELEWRRPHHEDHGDERPTRQADEHDDKRPWWRDQ
jgi:hypothetical protein